MILGQLCQYCRPAADVTCILICHKVLPYEFCDLLQWSRIRPTFIVHVTRCCFIILLKWDLDWNESNGEGEGQSEKKTQFHPVLHCHLAALPLLRVKLCVAVWEEMADLLDSLHLRCWAHKIFTLWYFNSPSLLRYYFSCNFSCSGCFAIALSVRTLNV
jgi:hypothetical protein